MVVAALVSPVSISIASRDELDLLDPVAVERPHAAWMLCFPSPPGSSRSTSSQTPRPGERTIACGRTPQGSWSTPARQRRHRLRAADRHDRLSLRWPRLRRHPTGRGPADPAIRAHRRALRTQRPTRRRSPVRAPRRSRHRARAADPVAWGNTPRGQRARALLAALTLRSGIYNVCRDHERVSNTRFTRAAGWHPRH
jgi:hypothetical protein